VSLSPVIERRHFLGSAAGTTAFFAMHDLRSLAVQAGAAAQVQTGARILSLDLLFGAPTPNLTSRGTGGEVSLMAPNQA
jgi:hypothetical protein